MTQSHRIDEAIVRIAFSRIVDSCQHSDQLERIVETKLMVIADEVFHEFSTRDEVVRIDRLDIDLGTMPYLHFQQEMEERFRHQLREALAKTFQAKQEVKNIRDPLRHPMPDSAMNPKGDHAVLPDGQTKKTAKENTDSFNRSNTEAIGSGKTIQEKLIGTLLGDRIEGWEELWHHCLRNHPEFLKEMLKHYVKQARVRKTMANTFPLTLLLKIVSAFHPSATKHIDDLFKAEEKDGQREERSTKERMLFKQRLWHITLANVVLEQKTTFQQDAWVKSLLQQMGRDGESGAGTQLVRLRTLLSQSEESARRTREQFQEREVVVNEHTDFQPCVRATHAQDFVLMRSYEFYEELKAYVWNGTQNRNEEGLSYIIEGLSRQVPWLLLRLFRELQTEDSTKRQWGTHISEGLLYQLLQALLLLTHQREEEQPVHLLETLKVFAKKSTNTQQYYRKALECLIQNTTVDFEAILKEAAEWNPQAIWSDPSKGPLRSQANGIAGEEGQGVHSHPSHERHGRTEEKLTDEKSRRFTNRSREILRQSITRFLEQTFQPGHEVLQDFLSAIDVYAQQVQEPTRYYERVLHKLEQNHNIDLEHILGETRSSSCMKTVNEPRDGEAELLQYLGTGCKTSLREKEQMHRALDRMIVLHPQVLRQACENALEIPGAAARLTEWAPESFLAKILHLLRPREYQVLQTYAELLANACYGKAFSLSSDSVQKLKWECLFRYAIEEGQSFETNTFVTTFMESVTQRVKSATFQEIAVWLSQHMAMDLLPATVEVQRRIMKSLAHKGEQILRAKQESSGNLEARPIKDIEQKESEWTEDIYIHNAGQVLAAPYVSKLFELLNLTHGSAFLDQQSAVKGVHVLQFLVNEQTKTPDYQLALNKILCGMRTGIRIKAEMVLDEQEKKIIEGMLQGMIQNWKSIGHTSITGLRESFLQREGRLRLKEEAWHLHVEPKSFDMLLDRLPWSFSTIKFPWMDRVLYVKWR